MGPTGPTGPAVTAVSLSAQNDAGVVITLTTGGTPIPLRIWTYIVGFSANDDSTAFEIRDKGNYLVSYSIWIKEVLTGSSSAIFLNDGEVQTTRAAPDASDTLFVS